MALAGLKDYHLPESVAETTELLQKYGDGALIVAGGTFVHGLSARGLLSGLDAVIDVSRLDLAEIKSGGSGITIGGTAKYRDIAAHPDVVAFPELGAVRDALTYPPAQIMNAATIGGCVAASCPLFDLPVSLLALNARVNSEGPSGQKSYAIEDFFDGLFENAMEPGEIVTAIEIPTHPDTSASAFVKLETNANDLAILNAAAFLTVENGACTAAEIFVGGGVGETPVRAPGAVEALVGQKPTDDVVAAAANAAKDNVSTMDDQRASAAYRKAMVEVMTRKAITGALARLK